VGHVHTAKQLCIDKQNKKIYFCDREGLRLHRVNLDGSNHEVIVKTGDWQTEPEKSANAHYCPVGITISHKLNKFFWTQKGPSKGNDGTIFAAPLDLPAGTDLAARNDIEVIASHLPECIDLFFDDDTGILYWTDRGELPLGNTLNKKQIIGADANAKHQIIAQGFAEAIGLAFHKEKQVIYVSELGGRIWQCGLEPGPKRKLYENAGSAFTGLTFVKY
jgi:sugar lactone lactonase YvrE